jgi:hypothetical protein
VVKFYTYHPDGILAVSTPSAWHLGMMDHVWVRTTHGGQDNDRLEGLANRREDMMLREATP